mgnify:CR=1 FL=1
MYLGRVAEIGNHETLLARGGIYSELIGVIAGIEGAAI